MAAFLGNLRAVAWTGLALAIAFFLAYALGAQRRSLDDVALWEALLRWAHVASGVMWIGLLYYFNFVQLPNAGKMPEEARAALGQVISPAALFWFRWAAMATLVVGLALAALKGYLLPAYALGLVGVEGAGAFDVNFCRFIGAGMWLATIMWFNVWFVIWPNQRRALNIGGAFPDLDAAAKAAAGKTAMLFSRINTLLSLPMLVAMTGAQTLG